MVSPLDAERYALLVEDHGRHVLRVGDYLDTMLVDESALTLNPSEAFGVRTHFDDLDRPVYPGAKSSWRRQQHI